MPVYKFRTFEEAELALTKDPGDPSTLATRVSLLWLRSAALTTPLDFRGVRKYRSIEEAGADRQRLAAARSR